MVRFRPLPADERLHDLGLFPSPQLEDHEVMSVKVSGQDAVQDGYAIAGVRMILTGAVALVFSDGNQKINPAGAPQVHDALDRS